MIHFIGTTFNKLLIKIEIILQLTNCNFSFYIAFASKAILTLHTCVALKWLHLRWYPRHLNNNLYQDIKNKSSHEPLKALSGVISIYLSQKALTCWMSGRMPKRLSYIIDMKVLINYCNICRHNFTFELPIYEFYEKRRCL